jgi:hypothetical protein
MAANLLGAQRLGNSQFYTYLHCKPNGDPFYVGKGKKYRAYNLNREHNRFHQNTVNKYGKENILIFIFDCETEEQALEDEVKYIYQLRKEGYALVNLTQGGEGITGLKHSVETKTLLSKKATGRKHSPERNAAQSARMKGSPSPHKGMRHSEETKIRISKSSKGRIKTDEERVAISERQKGKLHPRGKGTCSHCKREIDLCHLKRYHLDKCKERKDE